MCRYTGDTYRLGVQVYEVRYTGVWARKTCLVVQATGVCLWEGLRLQIQSVQVRVLKVVKRVVGVGLQVRTQDEGEEGMRTGGAHNK